MMRGVGPDFRWFGVGRAGGQWALVIVAAVVFVLFAWGMRYLAAGRAVYAVGSDFEAARLAGVRPRRVTIAVFVVMGALTAAAALLTAVRLPHIDPKTGRAGSNWRSSRRWWSAGRRSPAGGGRSSAA